MWSVFVILSATNPLENMKVCLGVCQLTYALETIPWHEVLPGFWMLPCSVNTFSFPNSFPEIPVCLLSFTFLWSHPVQTCLWRYLPSHAPCLVLFLISLHEFSSRFRPLNIRCTAINYLVLWSFLTNFIFSMSYTDSRANRVMILDLKAVEPVTKNK